MTKRLFLIAGAALSVGTFAQAQTVDQGRQYASELMADAATRTSSLAPAAQDFTPAVHGYEQFRFDWNNRDDSGLDSKDNKNTIGFQNARTRLNVSGNIANENWGYFIQFGFGDQSSDNNLGIGSDPGGSGAFLEDAYGWFKMGNGWTLKWGQFRAPFAREELVGDTYQLFADRSVVNSVYTVGRVQGAQIGYEGDQFRAWGMVDDGAHTANTDYTAENSDYGLTARGEWKWAGDWKQAKDFTSFQNSEYFGMLGAAIHFQDGGNTIATTDASDLAATIDASVEGNGWNAFAAVIYNDYDPSGGTKLNDWAFQIQGGVFVTSNWELIAGYNVIVPDSNWGPGLDKNFNTICVGVNHYIVPESHAAKITVDCSIFLDNPSECGPLAGGSNTSTGLLASDKDSQWNLRAQIQLMF